MKNHDNNFLYGPMIGNFVSWFIGVAVMSLYVNGMVSNPWPMLLGVLIGSTWTIWIHAYRQAEIIEKKKQRIDHKKFTRYRVIATIIASLMIHVLMDVSTGITVYSFLAAAACAIYIGTIFWLEFDFFVNTHRERDLDYIADDPEGAKTDAYFLNKKALWIGSKIIGILIGSGLYFWVLTLPLN